MNCPKCKNNTIPFFTTWLKSGLGTFRCAGCGAVSRVRKSPALMFASIGLGLAAAGLACYCRSWKVLIVSFLLVLIIDAVLDLFYRKLELTGKE